MKRKLYGAARIKIVRAYVQRNLEAWEDEPESSSPEARVIANAYASIYRNVLRVIDGIELDQPLDNAERVVDSAQ